MKLKTMDFEVNEDEYVAYQLLDLVYLKYRTKLPEEAVNHLEKTIKCLLDSIEKGYPKYDITDNKLIERVTFNEDTFKDLEAKRKNNNK